MVGEALVDVVVGTGGRPDEAHVGGSPLNVAVGLARLGIDTVLHARVGADLYGELILSHLRRAGVAISRGFVDAGRTSTAIATLDDGGAASYEFDLDWDIPIPDAAGAALVHTGSIAAMLEPGGAVARAALREAAPEVLRSFDPNIRPQVMGRPEVVRENVHELAAHCHVVKLSDEDAAWLGADTGAEPEEVLRSLAESGARFAVMTRGGDGCLAVVDGESYEQPAPKVELVDTIGAGDAFMSGLLFGLVRDGGDRLLVSGDPLPPELIVRALDTALVSGSIAVSRHGAEPPALEELDRELARTG